VSAYPGISLAANGTSAPVAVLFRPLTMSRAPPCYSLGLILTFSAGAELMASVQVTADQFPSANGNWNNHDILAGITSSENSNIAYPVTGVRLVVSGYSSGSVNLGVAQWP
jgi:hypothetical protein